MRIVLLTVTGRQPSWVDEGYAEYARRLRGPITLELKTLPLARRTASSPVQRAVEQEGERLLQALPQGAHVVELTERGVQWSTRELARKLAAWSARGGPVALLVGGPDGLAASCSARADEHWALSHLTLPHGLVRMIAAEALYRAHTLMEGHPYHRA